MAEHRHDGKAIREAFDEAVNMTPKQLEDWLGTADSKGSGQGAAEGESTGHESGRAIVAIKKKKVADLTDEDYAEMKRVTGYVHRHLAQRPKGDIGDTPWRRSLMNWGHDPER